ncbi:LOW QUALITY PROTEIN: hypothetical protein ACHAXS_014118 [Conticribra weissflogii]
MGAKGSKLGGASNFRRAEIDQWINRTIKATHWSLRITQSHTTNAFNDKNQFTTLLSQWLVVFTLLLALHHAGIYKQALINKQGKYWPNHVPANEIG